MEITLPRKVLAAMLLLAAKNDIRFYINALLVEISPDDVRIVATNGHILGVYRIEEKTSVDEPVSIIIPREVVEQIRPSKSVAGVILRRHDDGTCALVDLDMTFGFTPTAAQFPDYRRVVPEKVSGRSGHYNPEYLATFVRVAKALGTSKPLIELVQNGEKDSAIVHLPFAGDKFIGVVMPVRVDPPPLVSPAWVRQRCAPPQKTEPAKAASQVPA